MVGKWAVRIGFIPNIMPPTYPPYMSQTSSPENLPQEKFPDYILVKAGE